MKRIIHTLSPHVGFPPSALLFSWLYFQARLTQLAEMFDYLMMLHHPAHSDIAVVVPSLCHAQLCYPMDCKMPGFPDLHLSPWVCSNSCALSLWCHPDHLILCCLLLFLPCIFPTTRVFSNGSALHIRWLFTFSFSISPSSEHAGLISFRIDTRWVRPMLVKIPIDLCLAGQGFHHFPALLQLTILSPLIQICFMACIPGPKASVSVALSLESH